MQIEYIHASKFGNGAKVAEEFKREMATRRVEVSVHHIEDVKPTELPRADMYVFSSPGRFGKPIRGVRRFLKELELPPGTRYGILTTEMAPRPDKKTGRIPTDEEISRHQHVRPIMSDLLQAKGLIEVSQDTVHVTGMKGPLEARWQDKVHAFAAALLSMAS